MKLTVNKDFPYLGLEAYSEEHKDLFYGRGDEIKNLMKLIKKNVSTVVFGKSGLGKTSLLQAGLIPQLKKNYFIPVYVRLNFSSNSISPLRQTKITIEQQFRQIDHNVLAISNMTLWEYFHNVKLLNGFVKPILIFDQFEEIFSLGKANSKLSMEFVEEMGSLIENKAPETILEKYKETGVPFDISEQNFRVILCLREDYLPHMENLNQYIPSLKINRFRLQQMTRQSAIEAVLNPGEKIIEETEATQIVDMIFARSVPEFAKQKGNEEIWETYQIEPFLLSVVCHQINLMRVQEYQNKITKELLSKVDVDRIIKSLYYQNTYDLSSEARKVIENGLLTHDGYRKLQHKNDLIARSNLLESDINKLIDRRILRTEIWNGSEHLEIIHDVLVPIIKESRDRRIEDEKKKKREEELKQIRFQEESKRIAEKKKMEEEAERFRIQQKQKLRFARTLALVIGIAAVVSIGLGINAFIQKRKAVKNAQLAYSASVSSNAMFANQNDPTLCFRLAEQAYKISINQPLTIRAVLTSFFQRSFYNIIINNNKSIKYATFCSDPNEIVITNGNEASLINSQGKNIVQYAGHTDIINSVKVSENGKRLVTASNDKTVRIWEITGKLKRVLNGHSKGVNFATFNSTGNYIVSCGKDFLVKLWDISGAEVKSFEGHTNQVIMADMSNNGNFIASAGRDYKVILWEIDGNNSHKVDCDGVVNSVKFTPDSKHLLVASGDSCIQIINVASKEIIAKKKLHFSPLSIDVTLDNKYFITGNSNKTISVFDMNIAETKHFSGHKAGVVNVQFSQDNHYILSNSYDNTIRKWPFINQNEGDFLNLNSEVIEAQFSPDEKKIVIISGRVATIWNLNKQVIAKLVGHRNEILSVRFSNNGQYIITAASDSNVCVWDISGKKLRTLQHKSDVYSARFSPDNQFILTSGRDSTARLWDITGKVIQTFKTQGSILDAEFSPDGTNIVTAGADHLVKIWSTEGELLQSLKGHRDVVYSISFSPDGEYFASTSRDNSCRIWTKDGRLAAILRGHEDVVNSASFSPDNKYVITASSDHTAKLWTIDGQELLTYTGHTASVSSAQFVNNGNYAVSVSTDGKIKLWPSTASEALKLVNETKAFGDVWQLDDETKEQYHIEDIWKTSK